MSEFITALIALIDGVLGILDGATAEAVQPVDGGGVLVGMFIAVLAFIIIINLLSDHNRGKAKK